MATFKSIPYGDKGEHIEVTEAEYSVWEDRLSEVPVTIDWYEWTTYDFLMAQGYFCSKPKCPRPTLETPKEEEAAVPTGKPNMGLDAPDLPTWEPSWSQSKILSERDKLLKEREKAMDIREKKMKAQLEDALKAQAELEAQVGELETEVFELKDLLMRARAEIRQTRIDSGKLGFSDMTAEEYRQALKSGFIRTAKKVGLVAGLLLFGMVWGIVGVGCSPSKPETPRSAQTAQSVQQR